MSSIPALCPVYWTIRNSGGNMFGFQKLRYLAAVLATVTFTAGALGDGALAQSASPSTLDQVISSKKLRVGIILSLPPFGMKNEKGEPEGFDVDIAKLAAERLGASLEIVDTTAADRIPNLRTNKVDLI